MMLGRRSSSSKYKVACAPGPETVAAATPARLHGGGSVTSVPSAVLGQSPGVLNGAVDASVIMCGADPFGKGGGGAAALSRAAPAASGRPPTDRPYVLIRSADPGRRPELEALAESAGFASTFHRTAQSALDELAMVQAHKSGLVLPLACLVDAYDEDGDGVIDQGEMSWPLLRMIQRPHAPFEASLKRVFVLVYSGPVAASPRYTLDALGAGARMVTANARDATRALELARISSVAPLCRTEGERRSRVACPACGLDGLTPPQLFAHYSLFHVAEPGADAKCPLCAKVTRRTKGFESFATHLEEYHTPEGADQDGDDHICSQELRHMVLSNPKVNRGLKPPTVADFAAAAPEKTFDTYALLVVRRPEDGKFLLVLESAHTANCNGKPRYWIPAGKARPGETMVEAAVASCYRDTHVKVTPKGLLRVLMEPSEKKTVRAFFYAEPDAVQPKDVKTVPSFHSVGAIWVGLDDLLDLHGNEYRSEDPKVFFPQIASGALQPDAFGSTWANLEALCRDLGTTPPDALEKKRDATLPDQWIQVERRYPNIAFKEHDVLARSHRR